MSVTININNRPGPPMMGAPGMFVPQPMMEAAMPMMPGMPRRGCRECDGDEERDCGEKKDRGLLGNLGKLIFGEDGILGGLFKLFRGDDDKERCHSRGGRHSHRCNRGMTNVCVNICDRGMEFGF